MWVMLIGIAIIVIDALWLHGSIESKRKTLLTDSESESSSSLHHGVDSSPRTSAISGIGTGAISGIDRMSD